ncbi:MAG: tRNA (adenosine(37)-N6)-threonylcarbamoyltransferase complex transferase subunit TsaD [Chlamydiae bacterium]|nr:tRNA (adenosine(37)-N6)-threonylcarbamoyltransferase complex transferase subunit TsaD [Chlamydiota bacterium]
MFVLGIESTCDETAASVVKDGYEILSNVISSQVPIHKKYGGVFPELASRSHIEMIIPVIDEALQKANITLEMIDLIAVANGPGLIGSILIGLNTAKGLALALNKPFIGINHIEAHLYAAMMQNLNNMTFPSLGVVISGGHTMLLNIKDIGRYELIGSTIDDAIGECFDKVASILDLPYPGGPEIEKLASLGDPLKYHFIPAKPQKPFDFSFSGLKTKILYSIKGQNGKKGDKCLVSEEEKKHIAASFQKTAFSDLIDKVFKAAEMNNSKAIYFGGGVSNNQTLRAMVKNKAFSIEAFWPAKDLSLDNGAMIAGLAFHKFKNKFFGDVFNLEAKTCMPLV